MRVVKLYVLLASAAVILLLCGQGLCVGDNDIEMTDAGGTDLKQQGTDSEQQGTDSEQQDTDSEQEYGDSEQEDGDSEQEDGDLEQQDGGQKTTKKPNEGDVTPKVDKFEGYNEHTIELYQSARDLMLYKIGHWLHNDGRDLHSISKYLGFKTTTRNLLNLAMTELMHIERRGLIKIPNLAETYFYVCDIGNMRNYNSTDLGLVTKKFEDILSKFEYVGYDWEGIDLIDLQEALMDSARIPRESMVHYTVSVELLKNRIFTDVRSDNETVRKLQKKFIDTHSDKQEKETSGLTVVQYHVEILEKIIPDAYAFVHQYVSLLCDLLLTDESQTAEPKDIINFMYPIAVQFSNYVLLYRDMLVDRCIEMKPGLNDVEKRRQFAGLLGNLTKMVNLLNPHVNPWIGSKVYANIHAYVSDVQAKDNALIAEILKLFGNDYSQSVSRWENERTIKFQYAPNETYVNLLKFWDINGREAFNFMNMLVGHLIKTVPTREQVADLVFDSYY